MFSPEHLRLLLREASIRIPLKGGQRLAELLRMRFFGDLFGLREVTLSTLNNGFLNGGFRLRV